LGTLLLGLGVGLVVALVASLIAQKAKNQPVDAPADSGHGVGSASRSQGTLHWFARKLSTMAELGVRGSLDRLLTKAEVLSYDVQDRWFDLEHGTDTAQHVQLADLDIRSENRQRGGRYAPTPTRDFKKLMNTLDFPRGSVFVDLGSGKGKTLMMAAEFGFKRVVGVEFSPELCDDAKRNWSIYRHGVGAAPDFEIANSDVLDYEIKGDENVFFMFNPFDDVVMSKFIRNLNASLEKQPRRVWIIYYNPVCQDILEDEGRFQRIAKFPHRAGSFAVYLR
jgi:hypothetical protein